MTGAEGGAADSLDALTGTMNGDEVQPVSARGGFDAMAFVGRVSPCHTWLATLPEDPAAAQHD